MKLLIVLAFLAISINAQFFRRTSDAMNRFRTVEEHFVHKFQTSPGRGKLFFTPDFQYKTLSSDEVKTLDQFLDMLSSVGPAKFYKNAISADLDTENKLIVTSLFSEIKWVTILKPNEAINGGYQFSSVKPKGVTRKFIELFF